MSKKLTPKQELFVKHYVKDFNCTNAAIKAGYSKKTAGSIGSENLTKPEIQEAIAKRLEKRMNQVDIDANYVLQELVECWRAKISDLFEEDGKLKKIHGWPDAWQKMIGGLTIKQLTAGYDEDDEEAIGKIVSLATIDKSKYLTMIGKHTNIQAFLERSQVEIVDKTSDRLSAARKRMQAHVPSAN